MSISSTTFGATTATSCARSAAAPIDVLSGRTGSMAQDTSVGAPPDWRLGQD